MQGLARTSDPITSQDAASTEKSAQESAFLKLFRERGALSDSEAHEILGLVSHTPRIKSLVERGLLKYAGYKKATASGGMSRVFVAVMP